MQPKDHGTPHTIVLNNTTKSSLSRFIYLFIAGVPDCVGHVALRHVLRAMGDGEVNM